MPEFNNQKQPAGSGDSNASGASAPGHGRKRILLIEDDPSTRLVLLNKLRIAGFEVDVAANGNVALEKLGSNRFDAIFMDLLLPDVKGVDVIKAARANREFGNRPIYVCTSAALMETWTRRGTKAGATKVFDRSSSPVDQIVGEVVADLTGNRATASSPTASNESKPGSHPQAEKETTQSAKAACDGARDGGDERAGNQSDAQTPNFMKRIWGSFGLGRTKSAPNQPAGPAEPPPLPATNAPPIDAKAQQLSGSPNEKPENHGAGAPASIATEAPVRRGVAVLTLDEVGGILSADEACLAIFGWKGLELVGQNVMVLLKDGLNNDMGRFLQRLKAADRSNESHPFSVTARKKDGTEFAASVTPLTWTSDTTLTRKGDRSRFTWTAVFRDLACVADSSTHDAQDPHQGLHLPIGQQTPSAGDTPRDQVSPGVASVGPTTSGTAPPTNQEREEWAARVRSNELELNRVRAALERATEERKQFEQKFHDLCASKSDLERRLEAQTLTREEVLKSSSQVHDQLDNAKSAVERAEAAQHQEAARSTRLEEELASLRRVQEELTGKLTAEQQAAAELRQRTAQLESQLQQNAGNLESVKADAGKHSEEQARLESQLRTQLEAAKMATDRAEAALKEEATRNKGFEERLRVLSERLKLEQSERAKRFDQEVATLRQAHEELQERLAAEQKVAADSTQRTEEMESQLRDRSTEVERIKAALEQQTAEQERLESEWRQRLEATETLTRTLETALQEAEQINKQSEAELVGLRREREELNVKLVTEQHAVAESRMRIEGLEQRLRENASELERVTAELKKSGRGKGFETELTGLHQMRDMLSCKLAAEQRSSEDSRKRSDDLESRLRENSAELERVKAEADKQAEEQARLESELQEKLNNARTAAEEAEAALKEKAARCSKFEDELVGLRHDRDELHVQLDAEQQVAAQSRRRNEELESRLRQNAGELEQVKTAADKYAAEHKRLESDLRTQLESAKAATERAEAAFQEEVKRNRGFEERLRTFGNEIRSEQSEITKRLEKELADSAKARGDLQDKLKAEQQATTEARRSNTELEGRLREKAGEFERLKADLNKQAAERRGLESELHEQLKAAKAATGKAETTCREEAQRAGRMEKELNTLRQTRDELKGQLASEQQSAGKSKRRVKELEKKVRDSAVSLERAEAELKKRPATGTAPESELRRQMAAAEATAAQAEESLKQRNDQFAQLERELVALREERQVIHDRFLEEQQGGVKSKRRSKELEKQLRDSATAFARFKVEFEKRAEELGRRDSDLATAKQAAEESDAAKQEALTRSTRLGEELDGLRQIHDDLSARFKAEQQKTADSNRRVTELESRLRESVAELGRTKAALDNQTEHRKRQASEQGIADSPGELGEELCRLRENEAARAAELTELELRVRESVASLARVTADLERERGERRRVEQRSASLAAQQQQLHEELKQHLGSEKANQERVSGLEEQLREREDRLARVSADWQKEAADRQMAEEQLKSFGDMSAQLRKYLSLFEESKKVFKRTQDDLESRLQASQKSLSESETRLQKETIERQHLEESLAVAQRGVQDQSERNALELARLKTDLEMEQLERKRMEGDALQSRYASLDSTRVGRAMTNNLRRQMRQPVEDLIHSTRQLLEVELKDEQKTLLESVLENALLVQTNLQETGMSAGASDKESGTLQP